MAATFHSRHACSPRLSAWLDHRARTWPETVETTLRYLAALEHPNPTDET